MWKCLQCGEMVESAFDACWNCGARTDGTVDTEFKAVPYDPTIPDPGPFATEDDPPEPHTYLRIGGIGTTVQFLAISALAPLAGGIAAFLFLAALTAIIGVGGMGLRVSAFVDLRNYVPFVRAMLYCAPLTFFPAYVVCRRLQGAELSRKAFILSGIVASVFPTLLITLDDDGRMTSAWKRFCSNGLSDFFEMETLIVFIAFAPASVILSLVYLWIARIFGEPTFQGGDPA